MRWVKPEQKKAPISACINIMSRRFTKHCLEGWSKMVKPIIDVEGLAASYRNKTVLHDVNLTEGAGTFTGIVGPNGAGKEALIKTMLYLDATLAESIRFCGLPCKV